MSEHDSDIEFDFFDDEPETGESPAQTGRSRSRPPGGPPKRPPEHHGISPTLRLAGLIAFGILIVILLVLWVQSCSGTSTKSSYQHYLEKVSVLAADSKRSGTQLATAIATPGIKADQLANKMDSLAKQLQADEQTANSTKAPSAVAKRHHDLVEALQLRVDGLTGLAGALRAGAGSTKVAETAAALAAQTQLLVASDVLWENRWRLPVTKTMLTQGVTGLVVPSSRFLTEQGVDTSDFWSPVVDRLNGNSTSGGNTGGKAVGTKLVSTTALPKNQQLSETQLNTVVDSTNLGFQVSVENSGDVQVAMVQVTLTIKQAKPITASQTIKLINPGESATVTFKNLPQPEFVVRTTLEVDVQPVPGETNPRNNSASYPVIFSLG
jgi:archaellum component FlaF (FlaF/FlaG flagellin family)